jgi:hypothetical protein
MALVLVGDFGPTDKCTAEVVRLVERVFDGAVQPSDTPKLEQPLVQVRCAHRAGAIVY